MRPQYPAAQSVTTLEWMALVAIVAVAAALGVGIVLAFVALVRLLFR